MPDDLTTEDEQVVEEEVKPEKPARSDNRFKDLSEKVETTAKERDEANAKVALLEKENEFRKGFTKVAAKYEGASDYEDKILEKYNAGYDIDDATVSVLNKAGKFIPPPVSRERSSPAGGSATTAIQSGDDKPIGEMTLEEKRAKLMEIERTEPGTLTQTLRSLNL